MATETLEVRQDLTSKGLRDRLFGVLDGIIDGKVTPEQVESVCYVSEQMIKSARLDLEVEQERIKMLRENEERMQNATTLLAETIENI